MKTNVVKRALAALFILGACFAAEAVTDSTYNTVKYSKSGPIILGEWNWQFSKAKDYAEANDLPMVVFWGNTGCSICEGVERDMGTSSTFAKWMATGMASGLVMAFDIGAELNTEPRKSYNFCYQDGSFPFLTIYWPQHDAKGKLVTSKKKKYNLGSVSASSIISKVESTLNGWGYTGGSFGCDFALENETDGNRYEIESNGAAVTVPVEFVRKSSAKASEDSLAVTAGGKTILSTKISWAAGQPSQTVNVTIPAGTLKNEGDKATMTLNGGTGKAQERHIHFTNPPNSAANPKSFKEPVAFGEWTMNIAKAKEKVAVEGSYTIVSIQGSKWCPDCANTDRNFLEVTDGSNVNRFKSWAKTRNIALVSLDIPNFNGPNVTDFASPCLLSRKAAESTLARAKEYPASGADEALTKPMVRSGLGYQTRKGITEADATEQLKVFHDLAYLNTDKGGFHRPEDGNKNRTGVPIFVLLRKDGSVAARFTDFASVSPMEADRANFEKYLVRFEEMMAIADGKTADDTSEIWNNRASAKSPAVVANGGSVEGRLSAVDQIDSWRLDGFTGNGEVKVKVAATGGQTATVEASFWTLKDDGEAVGVQGAASKTQKPPFELVQSFDAEQAKNGIYVQIKATKAAEELPVNSAAKNFANYSIASSLVLHPQESRATGAAPAGSKTVTMQLEPHVTYRIEGLGDNASKLEPVPGDDDHVLFTFKGGAQMAVDLECASAGGTVTYQKWAPGAVGFEPAPVTTPAKKSTKKDTTVSRKETETVEVGFRRVAGLSGDVKVRISLDLDNTDFYYDYAWDRTNKKVPRFTLDGVTGEAVNTWTKDVSWADGTPLDACVGKVVITPDGATGTYYGNGKVTLSLDIIKQTPAGTQTNVVDNAKFVINYGDLQKASAGKVAFLGIDRMWAKAKTVYARASETVQIDVGRIEALDGDVQAKVKPSVSTVSVGGDCDAERVLTWNNHDASVKKVAVSGLPADKTVKLTLSAVTKGLKTLSASNTVSIVTVRDDAPSFTQTAYASRTVYRYAEVAERFPVEGTTGDDVSFGKITGSLPTGLKVSWDKDAKAMLVSGVPTGNVKAGTSYTAVYQVKEKRPKAEGSKSKVTVNGLIASVSFKVVDPAAEGSGAGGAGVINGACVSTRTFKDLAVIRLRENGEGAELVGTLQLTLPRTGKASAKYLCASGTVSFAAKSWSKLDGTTLKCTLVGSKTAYKDWTIDVDAAAEGSVFAVLKIAGADFAEVSHDGLLWSKSHPAKDCAGYYTVTLADNVRASLPDIEGPGAERATVGSGYLTLTMNSSSQYNAGTMKWAGVLPNGTSFSGSSTLFEVSDELVQLPFYKSLSSGKDRISGVLELTRGAKDRDGKSCWETVKEATVHVAESDYAVLSAWARTEKSKFAEVTDKCDFNVWFRPYGGIYDISKHDLDCCCTDPEHGRGTDEMKLVVDLPAFGSEIYSDFIPVEPIDLKVEAAKITRKDSTGGANKITLSFAKKTGVVSGSFKVACLDAAGKPKQLSAKYRGVVQLGFGVTCSSSCSTGGKPFVSGSWTFDDKVGYQDKGKDKTLSVKRGGLFTIDVNSQAD